MSNHTAALDIGAKLWSIESVRNEVIKQIRKGTNGGLDELDPGYYATRNTFYEDAMTCYAQHNRPKDSCGDFKNEKKRLVPDTSAMRKDAGLVAPEQSNATKVYLCDFCPMKSVVMTKQRKAAGMYDEK